ncbi:MAG: RdgB/HAM1 family non-canonical purine NTP pyrophosphatase [Nevskiales bacterium]
MKPSTNRQVVLATGNAGKLKEIGEMLAGLDIEVVSQRELGIPDAEETGLSFVENAILKARHAAHASGLSAIADDSGLEVDALNGAPGIYSARYAGPDATDAHNNHKLLTVLAALPPDKRTARFQCLMVYLRHAQDPTPIICQGSWEGRILDAPRGNNGFGYDPLFWVSGQDCSSAELSPETKNRLSHRGQALRQLLEKLRAAH